MHEVLGALLLCSKWGRGCHLACPAEPPSLQRSFPSLAAELLQVKALVVLALLCRTPTGLVCVVSWHGLLGQMERLCSRERLQGGGGSDQYLAAAVSGLMVQLASNVVPLLRQAAAAARAGGARRAAQPSGTGGASSGSSSGGGLQPLEALLALLGSAAFRSLVVCDGLITGLADLLTREVGAPAGVAALDAHADLKVGGWGER